MTAARMFEVDTGSAILAVTAHGEKWSVVDAPALLISGWPQSQLVWRKVVPELVAGGRTVYTVDARGFGDSSTPQSGYDLETVARDILSVLDRIAARASCAAVELVGHDVGSWIAHAVAARGPATVRSLTLIDAAIPGVTPEPSGYAGDYANIRSWHFGFNRLPDLPEMLLRGHEREFLEWSFHHKAVVAGAIEPAALDEYARLLSDEQHKRAGFEYYREAFSDTGLADARRRGLLPIDVPVLTVGARHGVGELLHATMQSVAPNLEGIILDCGHYVPEERPTELAAALLRFWGWGRATTSSC